MTNTSNSNSREIAHPIENFKWVLVLFISMRVLTSIIGAYAIWNDNIQEPDLSLPMMEARSVSLDGNSEFNQLFINNWYRWDTGWYIKIAAFGQQIKDNSGGFLPLYPLMIRLFKNIFNINYLLAALLVSNLFCLVSLTLFFYITWCQYQSSLIAFRSTMLLITFPASFFLFAGYPESLFLSLTLACWIYFQKKKWIVAGLFGGLAAITRSQGFLLFVPMFIIILSESVNTFKSSMLSKGNSILKTFSQCLNSIKTNLKFSMFFAVIMPIISFLAYNVYLNLKGVGTITQSYSSWGTKLVWPWEGLWQAIMYVLVSPMAFSDWIVFSLLLLLIVCVVLGFRYLPVQYSFYNLVMIGLILMGMRQNQLLPGFIRYMLVIFPIFMILGEKLSNRRYFFLVIVIFLCLNILFTWAFINWFWVA